MITDTEFRKLLERVPNSYEDFISFFLRNVKDPEDRELMAEFIRNHPDASSGYVIQFYDENLWNEEDDYEDDDMIYDDDGNEIGRYGDLVRDGKWPC